MSRNSVFIASGIKLGIFTIVSLFVTGLLAAIMGNIGFGDGKVYQAIFTSASMLEKGDDVRIAGVSVGEVKDVDHYKTANAIVTFRIKSDVKLTTASRAEIRFVNLVGDRYLALEQGSDVNAKALSAEATIPIDHTLPSLDLNVLFNGFKPLFQALQPDQVNDLTMNLIQVLQGEGGTVRDLLQHTASLTTTLADRDQLVGEVINNLNTTLSTVDSRSEQLSDLVLELKRWMTDLARNRGVIGSSLNNISRLTVVLGDLLRQGRPLLKTDIAELRGLSKLLNQPENRKLVIELFDRLPESMTDQTRTGTYGSWYSYYLCGFNGQISLPVVKDVPILSALQSQLNQLNFRSTAKRCNL